jgi:hypothetical protein
MPSPSNNTKTMNARGLRNRMSHKELKKKLDDMFLEELLLDDLMTKNLHPPKSSTTPEENILDTILDISKGACGAIMYNAIQLKN